MGNLGPLENTEVLNLDSKNALVPTFQNNKVSLYGAIGGFVANQFIICGGYDFDNWEGSGEVVGLRNVGKFLQKFFKKSVTFCKT